MGYNDMRADLIVTMPDGYRLTPIMFQIPYDQSIQQILEVERRSLELKRLQYETEIAQLKFQLETALRNNKPKKWRLFK